MDNTFPFIRAHSTDAATPVTASNYSTEKSACDYTGRLNVNGIWMFLKEASVRNLISGVSIQNPRNLKTAIILCFPSFMHFRIFRTFKANGNFQNNLTFVVPFLQFAVLWRFYTMNCAKVSPTQRECKVCVVEDEMNEIHIFGRTFNKSKAGFNIFSMRQLFDKKTLLPVQPMTHISSREWNLSDAPEVPDLAQMCLDAKHSN